MRLCPGKQVTEPLDCLGRTLGDLGGIVAKLACPVLFDESAAEDQVLLCEILRLVIFPETALCLVADPAWR